MARAPMSRASGKIDDKVESVPSSSDRRWNLSKGAPALWFSDAVMQ
jgi:hypothetical protein